MARATKATPSAALDYRTWKARAVAILAGRAGTMPEREWKRAFIAGLDLENAAKLADTYRSNTRAADPRKRRR